jgi:hypothetical protein
MLRTMTIAAGIVACMGGVSASHARDLPVPAGKGWKHAETGIVAKGAMLGLPRTSISDSTQNERDVVLQFEDADRATSLTYYIFRPAVMSVPMWFDRARTQIEQRDTFGGVTPATAEPIAFAPPQTSTSAALRQVYAAAKGPVSATGLAVLPIGEWLVVVRLSSVTLDPAALDTKLGEAIAALGWPANATAPDIVAVPIRPCSDTLGFKKAKLLKPSMMQALLGSAGAMTEKDKAAKPVKWCRNGEATTDYGVYRADEQKVAYTLAIGDAGRVATVGGGLGGLVGDGGYEVNFRDLDGSTAIFPSFDRLPQPQQLLSLVSGGTSISRFDPGDKGTIKINSDAAK